MTDKHVLTGRLEAFKVKPTEDGPELTATFSFLLREQADAAVHLMALSELSGKQAVVEIKPLQARLPLAGAERS